MQRGRGGEPWQQRRVLDRVPGPVAAPPEDFVRPPAAEHDGDGEEDPRYEDRRAERAQEAMAEAAPHERCAGQPEWNRQPDVAHVEKRRDTSPSPPRPPP